VVRKLALEAAIAEKVTRGGANVGIQLGICCNWLLVPHPPRPRPPAFRPRPVPLTRRSPPPLAPSYVTNRLHFRHDLLQKLKTSCFTS